MSSVEDILRLLTEAELEELLELYREKYGVNNFHYLWIYNQCKWNRKLHDFDGDADAVTDTDKWLPFRKNFYTHRNGDFRKYGTYISLHVDTLQSISLNSWQPEFTELYECLWKTKLIDWQNGPLFTNINLEYCDKVKEIGASNGVSVQRARRCCGLTLDCEVAAAAALPGLPTGYKLGKLKYDSADLIHSLWTNNKEGSVTYVKGLIDINRCLGVYQEEDDKLVAWVLQNDFAGLGFLQVLPDVQRQGFGLILGAHLSNEISKVEKVPSSAWIVVENFKSRGLLEKAGYKEAVIVEWIQFNKF